jgi:hypothetical protein
MKNDDTDVGEELVVQEDFVLEDYDLSEETIYGGVAPVRRAAIYAAVRRPTTSSEDT